MNTVYSIAQSLHAKAPKIFNNFSVGEGDVYLNGIKQRIAVYSDRDTNMSSSVVTQIVEGTMDPYGCYAQSKNPDTTVPRMISAWLFYIANGTAPDMDGLTEVQKSQLSDWIHNPQSADSRFYSLWPQVQRCSLTPENLPK